VSGGKEGAWWPMIATIVESPEISLSLVLFHPPSCTHPTHPVSCRDIAVSTPRPSLLPFAYGHSDALVSSFFIFRLSSTSLASPQPLLSLGRYLSTVGSTQPREESAVHAYILDVFDTGSFLCVSLSSYFLIHVFFFYPAPRVCRFPRVRVRVRLNLAPACPRTRNLLLDLLLPNVGSPPAKPRLHSAHHTTPYCMPAASSGTSQRGTSSSRRSRSQTPQHLPNHGGCKCR
jgi:hypothetical protein